MTDTVDRNLAATVERMEARRAALIQALPADLTACESALPARIRADNASAPPCSAASTPWSTSSQRIAQALSHASKGADQIEGEPCPFLSNDPCSIYAHRPFVCRNHASFDVDAYWCEPGRMNAVQLSMLELGGAKQAVVEVLKQTRQPVLADIRDFFPRAGDK